MRLFLLATAIAVAIHLCANQKPSLADQPGVKNSDHEAVSPSTPVQPGSQPVRLQILVAELSATKMRAAGLTFDKPAAKTRSAPSVADRLFRNDEETPNPLVVDENGPLLKTLEESLAKGYARVLCRTTLSTESGRSVFFRTGGEFPYPAKAQEGISIQWMHYGTKVELLPVVHDKRVSLETSIRLSETDKSLGLTVDGLSIPGLRVRADLSSHTTLQNGETLLFFGPRHLSPKQEHASDTPQKDANSEQLSDEQQLLVLLRLQPEEQ